MYLIFKMKGLPCNWSLRLLARIPPSDDTNKKTVNPGMFWKLASTIPCSHSLKFYLWIYTNRSRNRVWNTVKTIENKRWMLRSPQNKNEKWGLQSSSLKGTQKSWGKSRGSLQLFLTSEETKGLPGISTWLVESYWRLLASGPDGLTAGCDESSWEG